MIITQNLFFKTIEWVLFLSLSFVAIFFMKEVFIKFNSEDTSFKQYDNLIAECPTITICLSSTYIVNDTEYINEYEYGTNFNISYKIGNVYYILGLGENFFDSSDEIIYFTQLITMWSGTCYKITSESPLNIIKRGYSRIINVELDKDAAIGNFPLLKTYFTSEKNAFGIIFSEWMDGEVLEFNFHEKEYEEISLRSEQHKYLKTKSRCNEDSFYECFGLELLKSSFDGCPRKCLPPITLPYKSYDKKENPFCQTDKEISCSNAIAQELFTNISLTDVCPKSCSILQYSGKVEYKENTFNTHSAEFRYRFSHPESVKVYEEYLIYDTIGMIGTVGGTLGIFIGFSFSSLILHILNCIRNLMNKYSEMFPS